MRHVSKTDFDWLFDCINLERAVQVKCVNPTQQVADVLTKGSSSQERWTLLTHFPGLMTHQTFSSRPLVVCASSLDDNMSKRSGEMPDEEVSTKSKPLLSRNGRPEALNEVGRIEGKMERPHPSPNTVR